MNVLFSISAIYMALLGLGFLFVPDIVGLGVVPQEASAALIAYLRIPASTFIGIAIINWMARSTEASNALRAIIIGNVAGFGLAAILEIVSVLSGNRAVAFVFALINIIFAAAFFRSKNGVMTIETKV